MRTLFILSLVFLFEKRNVFRDVQLQSWITLESERMTLLEKGSKSSLIKTYLLSMRKICFQLFALVLTSRFSCRKKSTKYYKGIWPQKCSMKGIYFHKKAYLMMHIYEYLYIWVKIISCVVMHDVLPSSIKTFYSILGIYLK